MLVNDLVHPEAVYHESCYNSFVNGRSLPGRNETFTARRPQDRQKSLSFEQMCDWLELTVHELHTLEELQSQVKILTDNNMFSTKYIQTKFEEKYRDQIFFAEVYWL